MASKKELVKLLKEELAATSIDQKGDIGLDLDVLEEFVDYEIQQLVEQMKTMKEKVIELTKIKREFDNDPFVAAGDLEELTRNDQLAKNDTKFQTSLRKILAYFS